MRGTVVEKKKSIEILIALIIAIVMCAFFPTHSHAALVWHWKFVETNYLVTATDAFEVEAIVFNVSTSDDLLWIGASLMSSSYPFWVEVEIEGTNYVFDPSYKEHVITEAIELATAMGYTQSAFLTSALNGATQGSNFIQNVNKSAIAGDLTTYAGNLIQEIKTNHPGATLGDIVGGMTIVPAGAPLRHTLLPDQQSIIATWSEIPASYRTTLRIQHEGIDTTVYSG
jgi:hypothetical protein